MTNPILTDAPATRAETVEHAAMAYREWGTPVRDFLVRRMHELSQLIRWTAARMPEEHESRIDTLDLDIRGDSEARGYEEELRAARIGAPLWLSRIARPRARGILRMVLSPVARLAYRQAGGSQLSPGLPAVRWR